MNLSSETERLLAAVQQGPERARAGRYTVSDFLNGLGASSALLACVFLTIPFLQPFSVGPLATMGGLAFATMGWRMVRGEEGLWLPGKIGAVNPGPKVWGTLARCASALLGVCRRMVRRGRLALLEPWSGPRCTGWLIIGAGLLMAIPFVGIPLNNTLPAFVILFACLARLERDGLMTVLSLAFVVLTLAYFAFLGWGIFFATGEVREWIANWRGIPPPATPQSPA
jgi:hypothetical protein